MKIRPTKERVKELLSYDPITGQFTWRVQRRKCNLGAVAGTRSESIRAILIGIDGRQYMAHQLAWLCMTGEWPIGELAHINGDRFDNRWGNFTLVKRSPVTRDQLTADILRKELTYVPETGLFFRNDRPAALRAGEVINTLNDQGYVIITLLGRNYRAHRLAWMWMYGYMPHHEIDHINRVRHDNRLCNLRLADSSQNKQNTALRVDNTSGFRGVTRKRDKWQARVVVNGRRTCVGSFGTLEEAGEAARLARERLHSHLPSDA